MKRFPWVKHLKRSQPELPYDSPVYLGNWSNGEFFHEQTPHERRLHADKGENVLGLVLRYINAQIGHRFHGEGIEFAGRHARRFHFEDFTAMLL